MSDIIKPLMLDETGKAIVEALTQREMTQARIAEINAAADEAKSGIEAKTDEQAARIPEVTTLAEDVSGLKDDLAKEKGNMEFLSYVADGFIYTEKKDATKNNHKDVPEGTMPNATIDSADGSVTTIISKGVNICSDANNLGYLDGVGRSIWGVFKVEKNTTYDIYVNESASTPVFTTNGLEEDIPNPTAGKLWGKGVTLASNNYFYSGDYEFVWIRPTRTNSEYGIPSDAKLCVVKRDKAYKYTPYFYKEYDRSIIGIKNGVSVEQNGAIEFFDAEKTENQYNSVVTFNFRANLATNDPEDSYYFAIGDSITHANQAWVEKIKESDPYRPAGGSIGVTDIHRKGFPYFIAKKNHLKWYNYGIGGSTLSAISANGNTYDGFMLPNGRYTQLADVTPDFISIFFGWNDSVWGQVEKAEEWLLSTYGTKIYYPVLSSSLIGTVHSDGTPYTTQEQFDAVNAYRENIGGKEYIGLMCFKKKFISDIDSTDVHTWYGAWNVLLEYLILKYPYAKIMPIVPFCQDQNDTTHVDVEMRQAVRDVSKKWGLAYFDFDSDEHQLVLANNFTEFNTTVEYSNVKDFRKNVLIADAIHPTQAGYKYIAGMIGAKMMSI